MVHGATALMLAARRGDEASVRCLLEAGADRTARNRLGMDAVEISRVYGPFPSVEALLRGKGKYLFQ